MRLHTRLPSGRSVVHARPSTRPHCAVLEQARVRGMGCAVLCAIALAHCSGHRAPHCSPARRSSEQQERCAKEVGKRREAGIFVQPPRGRAANPASVCFREIATSRRQGRRKKRIQADPESQLTTTAGSRSILWTCADERNWGSWARRIRPRDEIMMRSQLPGSRPNRMMPRNLLVQLAGLAWALEACALEVQLQPRAWSPVIEATRGNLMRFANQSERLCGD